MKAISGWSFLASFVILIVSFVSYAQEPIEAPTEFPYKIWRFLYEEKCSKCHTLERVFAEHKTEEGWRACVARMIQKSPFWITEEMGKQIVDEITGRRKDAIIFTPQKKTYADAHLLFIDRCTRCHSTTRILRENKTNEEWRETVLRMRDNAPEQFSDDDIPVLIEFLIERGRLLREDIAAQTMVEKCIVCHEEERIFLERKSRKDWEKCVADMRAEVKHRLKKDWFTKDEFDLIVDLLVKTQGF
ncbi:MAG: hypothetical protein FJ266_05325 [Planctomycetes bacterium]|nr:hypothetical protein [Planctomycetota bacterium]